MAAPRRHRRARAFHAIDRHLAIRPRCPPPSEESIPAAPIAWLTESLTRVDERLLTLLTALGPQAVAADPGLPLRLLPQLPHLPPMTELHRQLLGSPLHALGTGPAQGSGSGIDRAGLALRGPITTLAPSQWAYPRRLLHWRHADGGLLYRTRTGREPPRLRPMVIVLDTSPACWGVIESLTRPAAHALADTLARSRCPVLLLTAADRQVHYLGNPAERLTVLTHRSTQTPDIAAVLARAQALSQELSTDQALTPLIILLTHCRWGAEWEGPAKPITGLRALFVQYPGPTTAPPFAPLCERWQTLQHKQVSAVTAALAHLIAQ